MVNDDYQVYIFGSEEGNWIRWVWYVVDVKNEGEVIKEMSHAEQSESATTTLAEYSALLDAMTWLYKNGCKGKFIRFYSSSGIVVGQMNELLKLSDGSYKDTALRCLMAKENTFWQAEFELITEEENGHAKLLTPQDVNEILSHEKIVFP